MCLFGCAFLLTQIDAAYATLAAAHPLHSRKLKLLQGEGALREQCLAFDRLMVFDAKHALQNASIVGGCRPFFWVQGTESQPVRVRAPPNKKIRAQSSAPACYMHFCAHTRS